MGRERRAEGSEPLNKVRIQQSMKITVQDERSRSPKGLGSLANTEGDRVRAEGKLSLLLVRNELLAKQVEKFKASKPRLPECEGNAKTHSELAKKSEELVAAQKELVSLRKDKNAMEIELHSNQRKVSQLQHEVSLVNRELEKFTDSFGKQIEDKLELKEQEIEYLAEALENANIKIQEKDKAITKLAQEKISTKNMLKILQRKLKQQGIELEKLHELGYTEKELKKSMIENVNHQLDGISDTINIGADSRVKEFTYELTTKLESYERENYQLKLEIEEIRRDMALQQEGRSSQRDFSFVKPRQSERKLFTQGTLILDYNKMFGSE